jgi:hypothetical protein
MEPIVTGVSAKGIGYPGADAPSIDESRCSRLPPMIRYKALGEEYPHVFQST